MRYCPQCGAAFRALTVCPRDKVRPRADIGDPLVGRVIDQRYRILEPIGAGGMGQVYRAAHTRIACLFAVKVLYGDLAYDDEVRKRFMREAEVASALGSRYITRVFDFGEEEGLPFLAMEYLRGQSLADVLDRDGKIAVDRAVAIARQVALGLAFSHERGIVHRDLKSENVFIVQEDDEEVAKILDFGVARAAYDEKLTQAGAVFGTPAYMAPEQFLSVDVDARADLYSLGIMLHEMLSGALPFDGSTLREFAQQHAESMPPPLGNAAVGKPLEEIIGRLLRKNREARFSSARELVHALGELRVPKAAVPARQRAVGDDVADAISRAISVGAPVYNAGDHGGCYAVYRSAAFELLRRSDLPLAVAARLRAAIKGADAAASPTNAAWEMRFAFDDLLSAALPNSTSGDLTTRELTHMRSIASGREAAGHLGALGDYYVEMLRTLRGTLPPEVAAEVDACVLEAERAGGGRAALDIAGRAIHAIESKSFGRGTSGAPSTPVSTMVSAGVHASNTPTSTHAPSTHVDRSPAELVDLAVRAIRVGAPAYNDGRVDVCFRIYRGTVESMITLCDREPTMGRHSVKLRQALAAADAKDVDRAAWTLRHCFDEILAGHF